MTPSRVWVHMTGGIKAVSEQTTAQADGAIGSVGATGRRRKVVGALSFEGPTFAFGGLEGPTCPDHWHDLPGFLCAQMPSSPPSSLSCEEECAPVALTSWTNATTSSKTARDQGPTCATSARQRCSCTELLGKDSPWRPPQCKKVASLIARYSSFFGRRSQ